MKKKKKKFIRRIGHYKNQCKLIFSDKKMFLRFLWKQYKALRIFLGIGGIKPYKMGLDIIEENEDYIVLHKPAGVLVHPTKRNNPDTLLNGVLYHLIPTTDKNTPKDVTLSLSKYTPAPFDKLRMTTLKNKSPSSLRGAIATKQSNIIYRLTHGLLRQSLSLLPRNDSRLPSSKNNKNPGPIQRLDRDTSGIVLFGLSDKAKSEFGKMMMNKEFKKIYQVLVIGKLQKEGLIEAALSKVIKEDAKQGSQKPRMQVDEIDGKESVTRYKLMKYFKTEDVSLVEVELITGKMHQIRVHFAHIGHPVIGDILYGNNDINQKFLEKHQLHRQFLHASEFSFYSKTFGEKKFIAPLPKELDNIIKNLKENKLS
ncbi:RluA family pseudouridine synthase [Candidatus Peregrinibacteria bacterium]|jgi:23S rRNA-/tRNA-specific pseudouridylate synthase|nr:RluA family pseudouridine synthase [Candidatus Peregrinibacteria bacterium]